MAHPSRNRGDTAHDDDHDPLNRDPITGEPGSHPLETGAGTAAGAAAGAAVGSLGGPVGAVAGAVVGGIGGAAASHAIGETLDPTIEDSYWRASYSSRPYYRPGEPYEDYRHAYRMGWESYESHGRTGKSFDDIEASIARQWALVEHKGGLAWERAKLAIKDAWDRVAGKSGR